MIKPMWDAAAIKAYENGNGVRLVAVPHPHYEPLPADLNPASLETIEIELPEPSGIVPLHIEDEYVRNYLWERALIAIDDPCTRSHPHEDMNAYCEHKTELARRQFKEKNQ